MYIYDICTLIYMYCRCHWKMFYEKVLNTLKHDKVMFYNNMNNLSVSRQGSNFMVHRIEF